MSRKEEKDFGKFVFEEFQEMMSQAWTRGLMDRDSLHT
jgi:hypothetical protein